MRWMWIITTWIITTLCWAAASGCTNPERDGRIQWGFVEQQETRTTEELNAESKGIYQKAIDDAKEKPDPEYLKHAEGDTRIAKEEGEQGE